MDGTPTHDEGTCVVCDERRRRIADRRRRPPSIEMEETKKPEGCALALQRVTLAVFVLAMASMMLIVAWQFLGLP